jgi:hypothetical protein
VKGAEILNEHEAHRQHVLTMIETAQRAGRSEPEIVAIIERYFNTDIETAQDETGKNERGLFNRLRRAA